MFKKNSFNLLTENICLSETLQRLTTGVRKTIPEFENKKNEWQK